MTEEMKKRFGDVMRIAPWISLNLRCGILAVKERNEWHAWYSS